MSPTLHTALEPMAFRGLLQDKEREVLHSGPGGGTYHLYEGGVQAVLGQYQGGRAGYRDGALAGTGAGVLRDGGRGERQALEPMLSRNIIKLQITDNHILSKAQSKSKSF